VITAVVNKGVVVEKKGANDGYYWCKGGWHIYAQHVQLIAKKKMNKDVYDANQSLCELLNQIL
jgi:hypothetical protein